MGGDRAAKFLPVDDGGAEMDAAVKPADRRFIRRGIEACKRALGNTVRGRAFIGEGVVVSEQRGQKRCRRRRLDRMARGIFGKGGVLRIGTQVLSMTFWI